MQKYIYIYISAVQKLSHYRKQQNAKRKGLKCEKQTPSKQKSGDSLCMKSYYYYYYYYMYMTAISTSSHVHYFKKCSCWQKLGNCTICF